METLTRQITHKEFRAMEFGEDELKQFIFELIDGEIVARNFPSASHQRILGKLHLAFAIFAGQLGEVFFAPFGVVLNDFDDVQPDLMFVKNDRREIVQEDGIFGAPDLVVEIISPSSTKTDRGKKFKLYERMHVSEYWIIDIKNKSVEVYQRQKSGYELMSFAAESGEIQSFVLPGMQVAVGELFT